MMAKKVLSAVLALACCLGLFAGCNSTPRTGDSNNLDGKYSSVDDVISKLKESGIPIVYHIIYTEENDPNGAGEKDYQQKGNFVDERIETDYSTEEPQSGSVEIFKDEQGAKDRADYINRFAVLDSLQYQIVKDNVLVRLNNAFTTEEVSDYMLAIGGTLYHSPSDEAHERAYSSGENFIKHGNQVAEGMTIDEAIRIMGSDPQNVGDTYVWYDTLESFNSLVVVVEDGKITHVTKNWY